MSILSSGRPAVTPDDKNNQNENNALDMSFHVDAIKNALHRLMARGMNPSDSSQQTINGLLTHLVFSSNAFSFLNNRSLHEHFLPLLSIKSSTDNSTTMLLEFVLNLKAIYYSIANVNGKVEELLIHQIALARTTIDDDSILKAEWKGNLASYQEMVATLRADKWLIPLAIINSYFNMDDIEQSFTGQHEKKIKKEQTK